VAVQSLIYEIDLAWKATSQTGGLPWMPALAESATFRTKGHARVADGRIQPAQSCLFSYSILLGLWFAKEAMISAVSVKLS